MRYPLRGRVRFPGFTRRYRPVGRPANVVFDMGSTTATLTLSGVVPTLKIVVFPPIATQTWTAQTPSKFIATARGMTLGTITLTATPGSPSIPRAVVAPPIGPLSLVSQVPSKLIITVFGQPAILTLTANAPGQPVTVSGVTATLTLSGIVPTLRARVLSPIAAETLMAQTPAKSIVRVQANVAIIRFVGINPFDPSATPTRQRLIKSLEPRGRMASAGEQIST